MTQSFPATVSVPAGSCCRRDLERTPGGATARSSLFSRALPRQPASAVFSLVTSQNIDFGFPRSRESFLWERGRSHPQEWSRLDKKLGGSTLKKLTLENYKMIVKFPVLSLNRAAGKYFIKALNPDRDKPIHIRRTADFHKEKIDWKILFPRRRQGGG